MKKRSISWVIFTVCMIMSVYLCPVFAQTAETVIEFSEDDLIFSSLDGYDVVEIDSDRSFLDGIEGEPFLPVVTANVLLPAGAEVVDVYTKVEQETEIEGKFLIMPTQKLVPVSANKKTDFVLPNSKVYKSASRQRQNAVEAGARKIMRGHYLAPVRVHPVDYIPAEGKLILRNKIRIYVEYTVDKQNIVNYRKEKKDNVFTRMLSDSVLNTSAMSSYDEQLGRDFEIEESTDFVVMGAPTNVVQYLIITPAHMVDEFQPLADWKTKKGVPAEIVSITTINANYTGPTLQYRIKSCIRDYALNKGTIWVVLGADRDYIPEQACYSRVGEEVIYDIPADLYYSDIDVLNWDGNGNGIAGELDDGVDMGPDVFVGRISVKQEAEVTNVVNKILAYEKNCPSGLADSMLLGGARLWGYIGGVSDAEAKSERMWNNYIKPPWWGSRYRFYDTNTDFPGGASYNVNPTNINARINAGCNLFHMICHGSETSWGVEGSSYTTSHVASLYSPGVYTNIATIACLSNAFDRFIGNCLGEAFLKQPNGGAVSYIGSSRYGWDYSGTAYPGPSLQYNQTFYNYLFSQQYGSNIGKVFALAKASKLPIFGYDAMHWLQYSLNLLGDPEMPLYTSGPSQLSASHPSTICPGLQNFVVSSYPGAKVCLYKDNEIYITGSVNGMGKFETQINPLPGGVMYVTVTNPPYYRPYEGQVIMDPPPAAPTNLNIYRGVNCAILEWNANSESDIASYNVYRKGGVPGNQFILRANVPYNFYTDYSVTYGTSYQYYVTAVDTCGNESPNSAIRYITPMPPTPPAPPAGLVTVAGTGSVHLNWYHDTRQPDFWYYQICRSTTRGSGYQVVASGPLLNMLYTNTGLVNGVTYYYVIRAVNKAGLVSVNSNEASATAGVTGSGEGFFDSFEVGQWNNMWTQDSQNDWFRSTRYPMHGSYCAEVDGPASDATLTSAIINLPGRTNASVRFSWFAANTLDAGEYIALDISTDGGNTWTQRAQKTGGVSNDHPTIDVTGIPSGTLRIRFRGKMSLSNEYAIIDQIRVASK